MFVQYEQFVMSTSCGGRRRWWSLWSAGGGEAHSSAAWQLCKSRARISPEASHGQVGLEGWRQARGNHSPERWQWRLTGATVVLQTE